MNSEVVGDFNRFVVSHAGFISLSGRQNPRGWTMGIMGTMGLRILLPCTEDWSIRMSKDQGKSLPWRGMSVQISTFNGWAPQHKNIKFRLFFSPSTCYITHWCWCLTISTTAWTLTTSFVGSSAWTAESTQRLRNLAKQRQCTMCCNPYFCWTLIVWIIFSWLLAKPSFAVIAQTACSSLNHHYNQFSAG